jgi:hypothetical protein
MTDEKYQEFSKEMRDWFFKFFGEDTKYRMVILVYDKDSLIQGDRRALALGCMACSGEEAANYTIYLESQGVIHDQDCPEVAKRNDPRLNPILWAKGSEAKN